MTTSVTVLLFAGLLCCGASAAEPEKPATVTTPDATTQTIDLSAATLKELRERASSEPIIIGCTSLQKPFFGPCRPIGERDEQMLHGDRPGERVRPPYFGPRLSTMPPQHFTSPLSEPDQTVDH